VAHGLDGSCPDQSINKSTRCIDILVPPRSLIPNFAGLYAHKFPGLSASCPKIPTRRTVSKKGGIAGRHDLGSDESGGRSARKEELQTYMILDQMNLRNGEERQSGGRPELDPTRPWEVARQ
jgi:hypothetical protein